MNKFYFVLLLTFLGISATSFHDTTCGQFRCSLSELREVNYAKSLGIGFHNCNSTIIKLKSNGFFLSSADFTVTVETFYNETSGSIDSIYNAGTGPLFIKEYCDGKGDTCITIDGFPAYIESKDQNRGSRASVWRAIGMYALNRNKKLLAMQLFHPTPLGDALIRIDLDNTENINEITTQKCTKV